MKLLKVFEVSLLLFIYGRVSVLYTHWLYPPYCIFVKQYSDYLEEYFISHKPIKILTLYVMRAGFFSASEKVVLKDISFKRLRATLFFKLIIWKVGWFIDLCFIRFNVTHPPTRTCSSCYRRSHIITIHCK